MSLGPSSLSSSVVSDDAEYHQRVALWILKLKECRMLTQSLTEEILGDVTELCADIISRHDHHTSTALQASEFNPADIPGLFADSPFCSNQHDDTVSTAVILSQPLQLCGKGTLLQQLILLVNERS